MFNVKLESFDAAAKPKIIREVKAIVPNLTLIDVRIPFPTLRDFTSRSPMFSLYCPRSSRIARPSLIPRHQLITQSLTLP